jgi:hypothetical protein
VANCNSALLISGSMLKEMVGSKQKIQNRGFPNPLFVEIIN